MEYYIDVFMNPVLPEWLSYSINGLLITQEWVHLKEEYIWIHYSS